MKHQRTLMLLAVSVIGGLLMAGPSFAMPNFARQYSSECNYCHTTIPRLNRDGWEFRRAGFRMPDEIGKKRDFEEHRATPKFIGANYFSARLQMNAFYLARDHATDSGGYTATGGGTFHDDQIEFKEFTLYPLTGGFLKHWSSESEISGTTDEIEVENAYLRYSRGDDKFYWHVRFGVFHPFEGFGGSDRPIALSRPLFQTSGTKNGNGDSNGFKEWGFDETGIEYGFAAKTTSLTLTIWNGLMENAEDPAQGGGLSKAKGSPTQNDKDFQIFFNQFFGDTGGAISAYYYRGFISLGEEELYQNDFNRLALYANYPFSKVNLLAGYGMGNDKDDVSNRTAKSKGWFFETDGELSDHLSIGGRYDQYDPSDLIDGNNVKQAILFANVPMNNGIQLITELKNKKTQHGSGPDQTENSLNLRFIYIW